MNHVKPPLALGVVLELLVLFHVGELILLSCEGGIDCAAPVSSTCFLCASAAPPWPCPDIELDVSFFWRKTSRDAVPPGECVINL